jgi:hypothetical protein
MEYEVVDKPGLKAGPTEYRAGLRDMITVLQNAARVPLFGILPQHA